MKRPASIWKCARLSLTCLVLLAACDDGKKDPVSPPTEDAAGPVETGDAGQAEQDGGEGEAPKVTLDDGPLSGGKDGKVFKFLGIPYAKPPLGDLRWKLPVKNDKWTAVRDATAYGKRCAQLNSSTLMNPASDDEDCLYINVFTPELTPAKPLPVMFWIHGGGNVNGSASENVPYSTNGSFFYRGEPLAEKGVLLVTFNYRLGAFGFFAHPSVAAEQGGTSANQGLFDQVAALQWVHDNIAKFGGDPNKVTIFGESAGSLDVCLHMVSPKSRGLFHGAISQSGGCTTKHKTVADGQAEAGPRLATALGCADIACLRQKTVTEILNAPAGAAAPVYTHLIDGANGFLPDQPRTLFDTGAIAKVPYLLGSNHDEGTLFTTSSTVADDAALSAVVAAQFPNVDVAAVLAAYPLSAFMTSTNPQRARLARILGDGRLVCSTYDASIRAAAAGAGLPGVWTYNFDVKVAVAPQLELGATHGAELVYVFGTSNTFTDEGKALSDRMRTYWTNFAKNGDPNGEGLPTWGKFSATSNVRMNFTLASTAIVNDFRAAECTLWGAAYTKGFGP